MERFLAKYRVALVAAVLTLFCIAFAVQSFGNHLLYRTYGLDLGLYTKALHDYSHLHPSDCSFFLWNPSNLLADHFDLLLVLLSPLAWLVRPDWLLLSVQLLAVLAGALGIYALTRDLCRRELPALLTMLLVLCQFGVWHALSFDYHSNVVAACLLPWLILFVRRQRLGAATVILVLMAIAKETTALWLCFVLAALLIDHRRDKATRRWLAAATAGCVAYFAVVTLWVMPSLGGGGGRGFWRYDWMGASFSEVAGWLLTHPLQAVADIFRDFTPQGGHAALKTEFYICALVSGLIFTLFKPNYLIMTIPVLAMKMLSADADSFWGIANHYNIEICMVGCCAATAVISRMRRPAWSNAAATLAVVLALTTTLYTVNHPRTPIRQANANILKASHYKQHDFDVKEANRLISTLPADASVCATTMFTPHLAARDSVYIFPLGLGYGADYYLLLDHHWCYYEGEEEMVASMIADTANYRIVSSSGNIFLLKRRD